MNEKQINVTFKTSEELSIKLKCAAQSMNMTQQDLINMLCNNFIKTLDDQMEEETGERPTL